MNWLITRHGRRVDLPEPLAGQVHIDDIAAHLSRLPRFAGATTHPWPVAAHSLHVAALARRAVASAAVQMAALLHDAHEAYCSDIPSPFKAAQRCYATGADRAETLLQMCVLGNLGSWGTFVNHYDDITRWDLISLATERRDLMHPGASVEPWPVLLGIEPDRRVIGMHRGMASADWEMDFLQSHHDLKLAIGRQGRTEKEAGSE